MISARSGSAFVMAKGVMALFLIVSCIMGQVSSFRYVVGFREGDKQHHHGFLLMAVMIKALFFFCDARALTKTQLFFLS
jgi:hypothetical protein